MTRMIACFSQCIGFNLLMMRQLLLAAKKRTKFYLTALQGSVNGHVRKYSTRSIQFQPKLLIDKQLVPFVKIVTLLNTLAASLILI